LVCLGSSNESVACPNGVCRVIISLNEVHSTCFQRNSDYKPYVLILDLFRNLSPFIQLKFSCNKPLCNSKETAQQVLEILVSANLISKSIANIHKITQQ
jgi:hypothetical protein